MINPIIFTRTRTIVVIITTIVIIITTVISSAIVTVMVAMIAIGMVSLAGSFAQLPQLGAARCPGLNLHQMGAFDKWFEGTSYQNGVFFDNEADGCEWPWTGQLGNRNVVPGCRTPTNASTIGAGYL
jgi:hypothetical protein